MKPQFNKRILCLLLLWLPFLSNASTPVLLSSSSFEYNISPYISIFEDASKELTIDKMASLEQQLLFSPTHAKSIKLGISDSNFWLRFIITNPYNTPASAIFTLTNSDFDRVGFYRIGQNEITSYPPHHDLRSLSGGFLQAYTLRIKIEPNSSNVYLAKIHSEGLISTQASLKSLDIFLLKEQTFFSLLGLSLGLFIASSLLALYLWLNFRSSMSLALLGFNLTMLLYQTASLGMLETMAIVSATQADKLSEFTLGLTSLWLLLAVYWLHKNYSPRLARYLRAWAFSAPLYTGLIMVFLPQPAMPIIGLSVVINCFAAALFLIWWSHEATASHKLLLLTLLFSAIGILLTLMTSYNLLSLSWLGMWAQLFIPLGISTILAISCYQQGLKKTPSSPHDQRRLPSSASLLKQISQQLFTPINGVLGFSNLLKDTPLSPQQSQLNHSLSQAGLEILYTTTEMAEVAKILSQQLEPNPQSINFNELMAEVMSSVEASAEQKKIKLTLLDGPTDLYFIADYSHVFILLRHILRQVIKYTDQGDIYVSLRPYSNQLGLRIPIQITHHCEELFATLSVIQRQHPLNNYQHQPWQLLLSRALLAALSAQLNFENMTQQGASISLELPLSPSSNPKPTPLSSAKLHSKHILMVNEDIVLQRLLKRHGQRLGLRLDSTTSANEALALLRNQAHLSTPYDFVVIDKELPIIDGLQLAQRIQQDANILPKPKLLLLVDDDSQASIVAAEQAGIAQCLKQPVQAEQLLQALLEQL